jgi:hypothetical protein
MTMAQGVTEIERLIEQGLTLYGEGDLDGALLLWERVLVIDPENPQANSYVEYVRTNYELLTTDGNIEDSGPYGIGDDEPEYQIEILPGDDVEPGAPAPRSDGRNEGWVIGDDGGRGGRDESLLLELEADEPPGDPTFESATTGETVSFDDATREYPGGAGRPGALLGDAGGAGSSGAGGAFNMSGPPGLIDPAEFGIEITPGFGSAEDLQTPQGFSSQTTDVRRRELGFVQPTSPDHRGDHRGEHRATSGPPELKMTLRTPVSQGISISKLMDDVHRAPTADGDDEPTQGDGDDDEPTQSDDTEANSDDEATHGGQAGEASRSGDDKLTLDLNLPGAGSISAAQALDLPQLLPGPPDLDLSGASDPQAAIELVGRADTRPALADAAGEAVDLIATLPTPRPPVSPTKPLPGNTRPPATELRQKEPSRGRAGKTPAGGVGTAPTQELPPLMQLEPLLSLHGDSQAPLGATRDFSEKPTNEIPRRISASDDPLISAPTRELGLRGERRPSTEDETTAQVDVHKLRAARTPSRPEVPPGMDPIDARSAEILEDIERNMPAIETRDERTRRRITALLDRAAVWVRSSDLERAVIAADLALSEDPNSALAQKLIQRNLETFTTSFQAFLGDLQRTPVLARPLHELGSAPISPRAAFLLSRIDGTLSLDEILDVCGMPRLEAFRYLCQLFLRGILR